MKCPSCDKKLKGKKHKYDYSHKCGIDGTTVESAKEYYCKACDKKFIDIGSADEINKEISALLLSVDLITRQHLRFIRSEIFGENYFQFAKRVGYNPQHLREVEEFKRPMSKELSKDIQTTLAKKYLFKPIGIVLRRVNELNA